MNLTCHSEYGLIKTIYLNHVKDSFIDQESISKQWENLNYLGAPQYEQAIEEYNQFENIIRSSGATISYFGADESLSMDAIYCRDASIATDHGMILCNMGKEARKNEPSYAASIYLKHGVNILGTITAPGTVEGGDVCWIDEHTLAVGHSYRTNLEGIKQLRFWLEPKGINIIKVDLPHYKGRSDVFHLMSILSPVDKDLAVVYSPLMPVAFRNLLLDRNYQLIEVPDQEFEMACNVLALSPRNCVMLDGYPVTRARLEAAGAQVHTYHGEDISVKGGGGPTCLTRPVFRERLLD